MRFYLFGDYCDVDVLEIELLDGEGVLAGGGVDANQVHGKGFLQRAGTDLEDDGARFVVVALAGVGADRARAGQLRRAAVHRWAQVDVVEGAGDRVARRHFGYFENSAHF